MLEEFYKKILDLTCLKKGGILQGLIGQFRNERWVKISEFPNYSISDHGRVRNDRRQIILSLSRNQQKNVHVGLVRDRIQHKRSIPLLVAFAFLDTPEDLRNSTPIHLDGDQLNNHYTNLAWRPRWFAIKYARQFDKFYRPHIDHPVRVVGTEIVYQNSWEAATALGLLDSEIAMSLVNNTYVYPFFIFFEHVQN